MEINKEIVKNGLVWGAAILVGGAAYKQGVLAFDKFVPKAISKIHLTKAVASTVMAKDDDEDDDDY